jgi:hypothetical protein
MQKSHKLLAGLALTAGFLLALPSIALADNDRPHVGINFLFGVPVYEQPAYVYATPRPVYIYRQPRAEYYQRGDDNQDNRGYEESHRRWHDHHDEHQHHDENDD